MTDEDRERYLEVLLALNGYKIKEDENEQNTLPVNLPDETSKPLKYWGYTT